MPASAQRPSPTIDQIREALDSPNHDLRARAMSDLLLRATNDPSIRVQALEIFRSCLRVEQEPSTAISALRGLNLLASPEEARAAWNNLLNDPRPLMVARVALHIQDPVYAPTLLAMLNQQPEAALRSALVNILGRLKYAPAMPAIVDALSRDETRADAIVALGNLGDPAAIPHLEPFLADQTQSHIPDDRGWMLRMSDLAFDSLRQLGRRPSPTIPSRSRDTKIIAHQMATPPPLPRRKISPAAGPFIPLVAAVLELPWLAILFFVPLFLTGSIPRSPAAIRVMDAIAMIPALAGLSIGATMTMRRKIRTVPQWLCFGVGCALCGLCVFSFSWEFFHPR